MKSFMTFAATLRLAVVWVLFLAEASALARGSQVPKTGNSITVPFMLAAVVLYLVIGALLSGLVQAAG